MISFAITVAGVSLGAFSVMVVSIKRTERRLSLFDADRRGLGNAFTRKVLGLHTENPDVQASRQVLAASGSKARR